MTKEKDNCWLCGKPMKQEDTLALIHNDCWVGKEAELIQAKIELADWTKRHKATIIDGLTMQQEFKLQGEYKELIHKIKELEQI